MDGNQFKHPDNRPEQATIELRSAESGVAGRDALPALRALEIQRRVMDISLALVTAAGAIGLLLGPDQAARRRFRQGFGGSWPLSRRWTGQGTGAPASSAPLLVRRHGMARRQERGWSTGYNATGGAGDSRFGVRIDCNRPRWRRCRCGRRGVAHSHANFFRN
jgi:hypothetical protein